MNQAKSIVATVPDEFALSIARALKRAIPPAVFYIEPGGRPQDGVIILCIASQPRIDEAVSIIKTYEPLWKTP